MRTNKPKVLICGNPSPLHQALKHNFPMNDLGSVYTHYDQATGKNVPTPNKIKNNDAGGKKNGKSGK